MPKANRRTKKTTKRRLPRKKVNRKTPKKTIFRKKQKGTRKTKRTHNNKLNLSKIQSNYPLRTHKLYSASTQNNLNTLNVKPKNTNKIGKMYYANLYKNMQNKQNQCKIMNPNQEIVALPNEYPGDDWVHANLMYNRDKPVEAFDSDELKEQFKKYSKMC